MKHWKIIYTFIFPKDFEALPVDAQNEILKSNSMMGMAMIAGRSENFSSGYEQVFLNIFQLRGLLLSNSRGHSIIIVGF